MKSQNKNYCNIISFENIILAWKKARKGKTKKQYVLEFEKELFYNLLAIHYELRYRSYMLKPLTKFTIRDPKTRIIHKSNFRDRIVHHALVQILEPLFNKTFICDSCANRIGKGNLFALKRFERFQRKVTQNYTQEGFCLKADIKHYFQEVDHTILMNLITRKINDKQTLELVRKINANFESQREREYFREVCH